VLMGGVGGGVGGVLETVPGSPLSPPGKTGSVQPQTTGPKGLTTEMGQDGTDRTHGCESVLSRRWQAGEGYLGVHPEAAPRSSPGNHIAGLEPGGSGGLAPWLCFVET
jgi:hypothetical protein